MLIGIYWLFTTQHIYENKPLVIRSSVEIAARAVGQLCNVTMGLLVLPVTKNSVWFHVFGQSWEDMIGYHRALAYLFLAFVFVHAMLWWNFYSVNPYSFSLNVFALQAQFHRDNFTVPMAQILAVFMFAFMGVMSWFSVRRWNYDLFYFLHHFFVVVFLMILWHASMSWYFITAGLTLWAVDHIIRFFRPLLYDVTVHSLRPTGDDGIVYLEYTVSTLNNAFHRSESSPLQHKMGQYVFINIPAISTLEWHPFTISSSPLDKTTTHHIKNMSGSSSSSGSSISIESQQWTGKLLEIAKSWTGGDENASKLVINIDGPYGASLDVTRYKYISFIAGGIGITPAISCYSFIADSCVEGDLSYYSHLQQVNLVWIIQSEAQASTFLPKIRKIFSRLRALKSAGKEIPEFDYKIFITRSASANSNPIQSSNNHHINNNSIVTIKSDVTNGNTADVRVIFRRPELEVDVLSSLAPHRGEVLVNACGPVSLVEQCSDIAHKFNLDFKNETFII